MEQSVLNALIAEKSELLASLKEGKKFLIDSLTSGNLLTDTADASLFGDDAEVAVKALLSSEFLERYTTPVLIDFSKAVTLYQSSSQAEDERIKTAFMMSRVNFMGTDGIRGKVVLDSKDDFITAVLKDNAFTPELVTTTAFSFATILKNNEIVKTGDTVVIGNDGRDKAYDWALNKAVIDGFNRAGLEVLDTGVVPTAIIPWKMLQLGHRGGACLTASHNPSNQNGIKFFIDGAKLLPEGELGDFVLSAYMFNFCRVEEMPAPSAGVQTIDVEAESVDFMMDVLPENMEEALKDVVLVFDSANGATDIIGRKVLDKLNANYTTKNEEPTGDNINRACGVAEIEGTELFKGTEYDSHIPFVQEMFDKGRENEAGKVWGIPLDGDGDRGFLMYYDKKNDDVHVLDGDKCGYILAEYQIKKNNVDPKSNWFISTIESDIMTANAAAKNLGLNKKVVSVGDKWIGNFTEGQVLVGLEISGHLIFPINVTDNNGTEKELLSGVGLLTGLVSLAAIKALDLDEERIIEPFEPGFSNTFYVYFVDKSRHYRGSALWNKDAALTEEAVKALVAEGKLPADTKLVYEDKEDLNVLYINFMSGDDLLGCIFMRNSGTEDKNATYVKGQTQYQEALSSIGMRVQMMHTEEMKNESRIEYTYETFMMKAVENGDSTIEEVLEAIKSAGHPVTETDLFAVEHAMKKEGRIAVEGHTIRKK